MSNTSILKTLVYQAKVTRATEMSSQLAAKTEAMAIARKLHEEFAFELEALGDFSLIGDYRARVDFYTVNDRLDLSIPPAAFWHSSGNRMDIATGILIRLAGKFQSSQLNLQVVARTDSTPAKVRLARLYNHQWSKDSLIAEWNAHTPVAVILTALFEALVPHIYLQESQGTA